MLATGREGRNRHGLDQRERVAFHQHAILERAGLRFVRVANQVVRPRRRCRNRLHLLSRRKRGAAASEKFCRRDLGNRRFRAELEGALQRRVTALCAVVVETFGIDAPDAAQQPLLRSSNVRRRSIALDEIAADGISQLGSTGAMPSPMAIHRLRRSAPRALDRRDRGKGCAPTSPRSRFEPARRSLARRRRCMRCRRRRERRWDREVWLKRDRRTLRRRRCPRVDRKPLADVVDRARADPTDSLLYRVQRRQQQDAAGRVLRRRLVGWSAQQRVDGAALLASSAAASEMEIHYFVILVPP